MNKPHDPKVTTDFPPAPADSTVVDSTVVDSTVVDSTVVDSTVADSPKGFVQSAGPLATTHHNPGAVNAAKFRSAGSFSMVAPTSDFPVVPGYRVIREIARGGMGRVLAAFDLTLDRDVALKILLPGANADRFVRESKITARLPHPGIPPVHALGTLSDGSPFLAMKLIAGQTLAEEMKTADRPRLLQAFTQVCQAVGFAHSRGIIHRDLKPANVMVGAFGEVQVMDWGLAKELGSQGLREEPCSPEIPLERTVGLEHSQTSPDLPGGDSHVDQTLAGEIMGTPAYMSPEQARGERTDARTDVFSLGSILLAILTGHPPFSGKSSLDVVRRAAAADLSESLKRLDSCGADAELMAICRHCLSSDPKDRPVDGHTVADELTAYLNGVQDRLQTAERERAVASAREAEQRKRRKVQWALAATVAVLLLGGGAFAWWQDRQASDRRTTEARLEGERDSELRNKRQQAKQGVDANLNLATDLRKQYKFYEAGAALAQARSMATGGSPDRLPEVEQAIEDLAFVVQLDDIRFRKWIWIRGGDREGEFNTRIAAPEYRRAFQQRGLEVQSLSPAEAASRIAATAVKAELVAAVDDWALFEPEPEVRDRLLDIARQVDPGPWTDRLRDPTVWNDRDAVKRLAEAVDPAGTSVSTLSVLSELMLRHHLNPVSLLSRAHTAYPAEFEPAFSLGQVQSMVSKNFSQIGPYEAARALRPTNPSVWLNLGSALELQGDLDDASTCYRKVIALNPTYAAAHYNLGSLLQGAGKHEEAITSYRAALAADPMYAEAHVNLGSLLGEQGREEEAIFCYRAAISAKPNLPQGHFNLGLALSDQGKVDEAIVCYQKAIALNPKFTGAHNNLGNALRKKGRADEAIACYRKAIALDPTLAAAHNNLGEVLFQKRKVDEAIACYRQAIALDPEDAWAHSNLGAALYGRNDLVEAVTYLRQAIALNPKNADAHNYLGFALDRAGKQKEAIDAWQTAVNLEPRMVQTQYWLGKALLLQGRPSDSLLPLGEAAKHLPAEVAQARGLPEELSLAKRLSALEKRLPDLLAGKDQLSENRERLEFGELCRRQGRFADAAKYFAEAFTSDFKLADDLKAGHRYKAACTAVQAAAQAEGVAKLDDQERARLRKQALDWLRADLALRRNQLESDKPADLAEVQKQMIQWQKGADLAGIRESEALDRFPEAEQKEWRTLWTEVLNLTRQP